MWLELHGGGHRLGLWPLRRGGIIPQEEGSPEGVLKHGVRANLFVDVVAKHLGFSSRGPAPKQRLSIQAVLAACRQRALASQRGSEGVSGGG
jgi:hypothetical protein